MNQALLCVYIGASGAIGALARYGLVELFKFLGATNFPYAILLANLLGSFLMGLLTGALQK